MQVKGGVGLLDAICRQNSDSRAVVPESRVPGEKSPGADTPNCLIPHLCLMVTHTTAHGYLLVELF